ncbi:MAG: PQQ-dependent sugar dehydrogenase [Deltaproteobacteria bacterium]|nr:PQQ-dependent sugar dehydrogenase [Nannocystaceae bacterium]
MSSMPRVLILCSLSAPFAFAGCASDDAPRSGTDAASSSSGTDPTATTVTTTVTTADDTSATTTMTTAPSTSATTADSSGDGSTTTAGDESSSGDGSSSSDGGETGPVIPPCPYTPVDAPSGYELELVADGLESPMFVIGHPEEPDRLFVLEQGGSIQMIAPGTTEPAADSILDVEVLTGSERGLLGMAFHPEFPTDPRIYVNYTSNNDGSTVIAEYMLDPENDWAGDPLSERVITEIYQPEYNHNGGGIAFDDTGMLIIGMGDGGTQSTSRNFGVLLSKFLRIGVEMDGTPDDTPACDGCPTYGPFDYTIPADNPFVGVAGYAEEIYASGFRNPWRWSVDVGSGDIWVGDVGEGEWEEIDLLVAGRDYGWNSMEGRHCYGQDDCDESAGPHEINDDGLSMPVLDYQQSPDCAVIGGAVYRSCQAPDWDGAYFYSDYCNSDIRGLRWDGTGVDDLGVVVDSPPSFLGSGWNNWGDVYFTGGTANGTVRRLVPVE